MKFETFSKLNSSRILTEKSEELLRHLLSAKKSSEMKVQNISYDDFESLISNMMAADEQIQKIENFMYFIERMSPCKVKTTFI